MDLGLLSSKMFLDDCGGYLCFKINPVHESKAVLSVIELENNILE